MLIMNTSTNTTQFYTHDVHQWHHYIFTIPTGTNNVLLSAPVLLVEPWVNNGAIEEKLYRLPDDPPALSTNQIGHYNYPKIVQTNPYTADFPLYSMNHLVGVLTNILNERLLFIKSAGSLLIDTNNLYYTDNEAAAGIRLTLATTADLASLSKNSTSTILTTPTIHTGTAATEVAIKTELVYDSLLAMQHVVSKLPGIRDFDGATYLVPTRYWFTTNNNIRQDLVFLFNNLLAYEILELPSYNATASGIIDTHPIINQHIIDTIQYTITTFYKILYQTENKEFNDILSTQVITLLQDITTFVYGVNNKETTITESVALPEFFNRIHTLTSALCVGLDITYNDLIAAINAQSEQE